MIIDHYKNWKLYSQSEAWVKTFEFLLALKPNAEEKKYPLLGDDVFARVMSYNTKSLEEAVLEAHKNYIDIQAVITGQEGIAWYPSENLIVKTLYNPEKDVEFYQRPAVMPGRIDLTPGYFAALFPQDAHSPQLTISNTPHPVKKVVVKINMKFV